MLQLQLKFAYLRHKRPAAFAVCVLACGALILSLAAIFIDLMAPYIGLGSKTDFWAYQTWGLARQEIFWRALTAGIVSFILAGSFLSDRTRHSLQAAARSTARGTLKVAGYALIIGASTLGALKLFGIYLPHSALENTITTEYEPERTIRSLALYPYDGFHFQENFHHRGDMPWEPYRYDYDVHTGPYGFLVDFDPLHPPAKRPGEIRIVLIGGSGAQGWGGQTNDKMLYRQLEHRLNEKFASTSLNFRVVDFAMAGTQSYQNFIALNRYGHALQADWILSYSGRNDMTTTQVMDGYFGFQWLLAYSNLALSYNWPPEIAWIGDWFPNLMKWTLFGPAVKLGTSYDYFVDEGLRDYRQREHITASTPAEAVDQISIPLFVNAMQSIKRDFEGIPITIAWQAMGHKELEIDDRRRHLPPETTAKLYEHIFQTARTQLAGYYNDDWSFLDVHGYFYAHPNPGVGTHLNNEGHAMVAQMIADFMAPRLCQKLLTPAQIQTAGDICWPYDEHTENASK